MRVLVNTLVVFISLTVVAGCGNGSNGGGDTGKGGIASPADFQNALALVNCQYKAKCGSIGVSEEKQCETDAKAAIKKYPPAYSNEEAVAQKRLTFDAKQAQACVDAFKTAGCTVDQNFAAYAACQNVFKAQVKVGDGCKAGGECVMGYCAQGKTPSDGCPGTCTAFIATGMTCDPNDSHCADSDFCEGTAKKCVARAADGKPCGSMARCGLNSFCHGYIGASMGKPETKGTCGPAGKVGDACVSYLFGNTDCTPGLFCDKTVATKPVCAARLAQGTSCTSLAACVDPLDCVGLDFDMNGKLKTPGTCAAFLDVNMSCKDPNVYETGCVYDTLCDTTSKVCLPSGNEGGDCSMNGGYCGDNLYCDSITMKCTPSVPLNGPCMPATGMNGQDPCHDGSCDATAKTCVLACM